MSNFLNEIYYSLNSFLNYEEHWKLYFVIFPYILLMEIPLYSLIVIAYLKKFWKDVFLEEISPNYFPNVTCIIPCYNEGRAIVSTTRSLVEQIYKGNIEIIIVVDGSDINKSTYEGVLEYATKHNSEFKNNSRYIKVIPKKQRSGKVSSLNIGASLAKGELLIIIDGDCSLDNDLVAAGVRGFADKNVIASSGNVRVRNTEDSLLTKFQAIEYMIGLQLSRTGFSELGILNNISGAHGIFRKSFVNAIGGWKNGSAEDLDITIRIRAYMKQYPQLRIIHTYDATMHTNVPTTWKKLFKQRLRWDGDISYLYFRRYRKLLRPKNIGWKNLFAIVWYDFIFCLCVPSLIIIYTIWLFFKFSSSFAVTILIITYIYYFLSENFFFLLYIVFVSERKIKDFKFIVYLPLMPFYQYIMRTWTALSTVFELVLATHQDTTMAPWWVIKKTH